MNQVTLQPRTKRLKQLIKAHGAIWRVLEDRNVACFNEQRGLFIEAGGHTRWVHPTDVLTITGKAV